MTVAPWTAGLRARRRAPRLADPVTWDLLLERWGRADHREVVRHHQLGFLHARGRHRRRRRPPVPLVQLLVRPGESIDFADERTGFPGLDVVPRPGRVLTLWADDLLSVHHGDDWIFVVDLARPLPERWLRLAFPQPGRGGQDPRLAVVTAAFDGPTPAGAFRLADVDATTYATLARVDDLRSAAPARPRARSGAVPPPQVPPGSMGSTRRHPQEDRRPDERATATRTCRGVDGPSGQDPGDGRDRCDRSRPPPAR